MERLQVDPTSSKISRRLVQEPVSLATPVGEENDTQLGDLIEDRSAPNPSDTATLQLLAPERAY